MTHDLQETQAGRRAELRSFPSPSPVKPSVMLFVRRPILLVIILLAMLHGIRPQAPAPAPDLDCTNALLNLSSCLTYVEEGSNLTWPQKGCCPGLAVLLATEPVCLCQVIGNYASFGIQIDTTKVLMLPTICRADAPPASLCAVLRAPIASLSPTSGGSGSSPSTPAAVPQDNNSGRSILRTTGSVLLSALCCTAVVIATF
ncbi:non-specific lipid-transfer protein-like protein [Cocos nucifera]|uniref:Non-specific lipid-transfer protein-like protein n=1 Tax=Cocos nucifera TaxID=13894 RepID=A0A8K0MV87_COCNU|nr:non-specific lipid-transfer protein-like protein [Cocos nucifera]